MGCFKSKPEAEKKDLETKNAGTTEGKTAEKAGTDQGKVAEKAGIAEGKAETAKG